MERVGKPLTLESLNKRFNVLELVAASLLKENKQLRIELETLQCEFDESQRDHHHPYDDASLLYPLMEQQQALIEAENVPRGRGVSPEIVGDVVLDQWSQLIDGGGQGLEEDGHVNATSTYNNDDDADNVEWQKYISKHTNLYGDHGNIFPRTKSHQQQHKPATALNLTFALLSPGTADVDGNHLNIDTSPVVLPDSNLFESPQSIDKTVDSVFAPSADMIKQQQMLLD